MAGWAAQRAADIEADKARRKAPAPSPFPMSLPNSTKVKKASSPEFRQCTARDCLRTWNEYKRKSKAPLVSSAAAVPSSVSLSAHILRTIIAFPTIQAMGSYTLILTKVRDSIATVKSVEFAGGRLRGDMKEGGDVMKLCSSSHVCRNVHWAHEASPTVAGAPEV
eukprot:CAMPEP_0182484612 /NCGR_PEP_ID=MMETSP1319-20130603/43733_1 /TAXON_ID=172717 /ORGANISM="Bolidomonas pacifica, Strain RCC208" /LENGTH=164 /DNA_ID=CAMNT_0024686525 /DNA_START=1221 /DNA_END=1716 /DNA_ORIENTATION=+